eukprot:15148589-Heterocapsa_arctica.AAC.1
MIEVASHKHTRKHMRDGNVDTVSRIDRLFCNMIPSDLEARGPHLQYWKEGPRRKGTPRWVADHLIYPKCLEEASS